MPQAGHEPVPAVPAPHAEHADLAPFTAHPAPDLHDVATCEPLSCHVLDGHAPHTTLADAEHAEFSFWPAPHEPHVLQLACPPWSCHQLLGQSAHEPYPARPAGQLAQLCLFDATAQPDPALHEAWAVWSWYQFDGQSLHVAWLPAFW